LGIFVWVLFAGANSFENPISIWRECPERFPVFPIQLFV